MFTILVIGLILLLSRAEGQNQADKSDPIVLEDSLSVVMDGGLGVKYMQSYMYDYVTISRTRPVLTDLIVSLSKRLTTVLQERQTIVTAFSNQLSGIYANSLGTSSPFPWCCSMSGPNVVYQDRFKNKVNLNSTCYIRSSDSSSSKSYPTIDIQTTLMANLNANPDLKYQYFGTEDGCMFIYPGWVAAGCGKYDPRQRPWYISAVSPVPKDVIFLIENTISMNGIRLGGDTLQKFVAKALKMLINSMQPDDRVSIVAFSSSASVLGTDGEAANTPCIPYELPYATPYTKKIFNRYLDQLVPGTSANSYSIGLEKAFLLFANSTMNNDPNRKKGIVLLTGVETTDSVNNIIRTVTSYNSKYQGAISIMAYALGVPTSRTTEILGQLTKAGQSKPGFFTVLDPAIGLRTQMSAYFNFFSVQVTNPIVTAPYYDAFGLGLINSVVLPVFSKNQLVGVVGVDMNNDDWIGSYISPAIGEDNYGFIVEKATGDVMYHPLIPIPEALSSDTVIVNIHQLERNPNLVKNVIDPMLKGQSGFYNMTSNEYKRNGFAFVEGLTIKPVPLYYYYSGIANSSYAMCLVNDLFPMASQLTLKKPLSPGEVSFVYHEYSLYSSLSSSSPLRMTYCKNYFRESALAQSFVKFSPSSFIDSGKYMTTEETINDFNLYQSIVLKKTNDTLFIPNVVNDVHITTVMNSLWKPAGTLYVNNVPQAIWRYMGTQRGVMRMFPGTKMFKSYDPRNRRWYYKALSQPTDITISPPYLDLYGAGYVVTLSQAVKEAVDPWKECYGVLGMDIKTEFLWQVINTLTGCAESGLECFLMDKAGFILVHKSWIIADWTRPPPVQNVHITLKEPIVAGHMISKGYLVKTTCQDLFLGQSNNFFVADFSIVDHLTEDKAYYKASRILTTNVYLVQVNRYKLPMQAEETLCICNRVPDIKYPGPCSSVSPVKTGCECPCYQDANIDMCTGEYLDQNWIPCIPMYPDQFVNQEQPVFATGYFEASCITPACSSLTTMSDCHNYASCRWCDRDVHGAPLATATCGNYDSCWFGQLSSHWLYYTEQRKVTVLEVTLIALFTCLTLATIGSFVIWRRRVLYDIIEWYYEHGLFIPTPRPGLRMKYVFVPKLHQKKKKKKKKRTVIKEKGSRLITKTIIVKKKVLKPKEGTDGTGVDEMEEVEVEEAVTVYQHHSDHGADHGADHDAEHGDIEEHGTAAESAISQIPAKQLEEKEEDEEEEETADLQSFLDDLARRGPIIEKEESGVWLDIRGAIMSDSSDEDSGDDEDDEELSWPDDDDDDDEDDEEED